MRRLGRESVRGQSSDPGSIDPFQLGIPEIHAATARHSRIAIEKTTGTVKKYRQLRYATAAKQTTNPHALMRIAASVLGVSPPSCHAMTAANTISTETNNPKPTKKTQ